MAGALASWAATHFSFLASSLLQRQIAQKMEKAKQARRKQRIRVTLLRGDFGSDENRDLPHLSHDINGTMLVFSGNVFYVRSPHYKIYRMHHGTSDADSREAFIELPPHADRMYRQSFSTHPLSPDFRATTQKSIWLLHMLLSDLRTLILYRQAVSGSTMMPTLDLAPIIEPFLHVVSNISREPIPLSKYKGAGLLQWGKRQTSAAYRAVVFWGSPNAELQERYHVVQLLGLLHTKNAVTGLMACLNKTLREIKSSRQPLVPMFFFQDSHELEAAAANSSTDETFREWDTLLTNDSRSMYFLSGSVWDDVSLTTTTTTASTSSTATPTTTTLTQSSARSGGAADASSSSSLLYPNRFGRSDEVGRLRYTQTISV